METEDFAILKKSFDDKIATLPFHTGDDYLAAYAEISKSYKQNSDRPLTLNDMSAQIYGIQAMKDRISEIFANAHKNFIMRKHAFDILSKAYVKYSSQSAQDKRKSDAYAQLYQYGSAYAESESLYFYCFQIMKNLDSRQEMVSRMITCAQQEMKFNGYNPPSPTEEKPGESSPKVCDW